MSLYQETILDHYRNPRNFGSLAKATHQADVLNPTCGDKLRMDIIVKNDTIEDIRFSGAGCAISLASASLLTEKVEKMPIARALRMEPAVILEMLGITLSPNRLKCGLLSLEALKKTLSTKI